MILRPHRVPLHPVHLARGAALGRAQRARPLHRGRGGAAPAQPPVHRRDRRGRARGLAHRRRPGLGCARRGAGAAGAGVDRGGASGLPVGAAPPAPDARPATARGRRGAGHARRRGGAGQPADRSPGGELLRGRHRLARLRRPPLSAAARCRGHRHRRRAAARSLPPPARRRRRGRPGGPLASRRDRAGADDPRIRGAAGGPAADRRRPVRARRLRARRRRSRRRWRSPSTAPVCRPS